MFGSIPYCMTTILSRVAGVGFFACFGVGPASSVSVARLATLLLASQRASDISEATDPEEGKLDVQEK